MRVRCVQEMDRVLHFMTRKGLINTGVLTVKRPLLPQRHSTVRLNARIWNKINKSHLNALKKTKNKQTLWLLQRKVIVIGAGASGLAAARQLQNFGTQVDVGLTYFLIPCRRFTAMKVCCSLVPGGCAGGEGSDRWPCLGRHLSGGHRRARSSNCQRLCEQPHCLDVWTGSDWSLES